MCVYAGARNTVARRHRRLGVEETRPGSRAGGDYAPHEPAARSRRPPFCERARATSRGDGREKTRAEGAAEARAAALAQAQAQVSPLGSPSLLRFPLPHRTAAHHPRIIIIDCLHPYPQFQAQAEAQAEAAMAATDELGNAAAAAAAEFSNALQLEASEPGGWMSESVLRLSLAYITLEESAPKLAGYKPGLDYHNHARHPLFVQVQAQTALASTAQERVTFRGRSPQARARASASLRRRHRSRNRSHSGRRPGRTTHSR